MALFQSLETRVKAILTADQIQQLDKIGGMKAVMGGPPALAGIGLLTRQGFDRLDLTEPQKAAIERLMAQSKAQAEAAGGDEEKLKALKQATWQQIMAVLTPEQRRKLAEAQKIEIQDEAGGGGPRPDLSSLLLTADQEKRLEAILAEGKPRAQAILEDRSLSEAEKQARMTALYQQFRPRFLSVLNPAQEQKFRSLLLDAPRGARQAVREEIKK